MSNENILDDLEEIPSFESCIDNVEFTRTVDKLQTLQINVGKLCNLACKHCHVNAGPNKNEIMSREVLEACIQLYKNYNFDTVDITGGAPEMNPNFEWFIEEISKVCDHIIVRTNLVILEEEAYKHLINLYKKYKVEVVCSLPYYSEKDVDRQRGMGVFQKSINQLQKLNSIGYGREEGLVLNLVYNPGGAFFPPEQSAIEKEYKKKLKDNFGVDFNHLFTITNNPSGRFADFLVRSGNLKSYMKKLYDSFNSATLESMMCRSQLSVAWDGSLYDCDFNQAIGLSIKSSQTIFDLLNMPYEKRTICFGKHCFACTAGQGSSCGGATK
ncbi:MAG: arsenosugar biosynthesis radical SAM protein ArsS [Clostridioides sp.]|jgi:radical SAM/Cys-rich protein|nr:arsenosugar biosynthesis radical SAM protein ArsS [Clostridioides sp.]